ncbi:50S ribosomal protein L23 [Candidatus Saccharibacteria bacterium]|nr:50S ribosomal protein L23 [Candidatus Saccharibacteria bacterium]
MSKSLLLKPRLSEKAYGLSEQGNTYVFDVPRTANRHTIGDAVSSQYSVQVVSVKIASTAGKPFRAYKKRGRNITGSRAGVRKAYVTLKAGDRLPIFASTDDKAAKEKK